MRNVLNAPFAGAEILNTLVGNWGVVMVAPFTALVADLVYRDRNPKRRLALLDWVDSQRGATSVSKPPSLVARPGRLSEPARHRVCRHPSRHP